jgi:hypothetical protein
MLVRAELGMLSAYCYGALGRYSMDIHSFQVWSADYVVELAAYLMGRAAAWRKPVLSVVEVGAGDGRLSHFLHAAASAMAVGDDRRRAPTEEAGVGAAGRSCDSHREAYALGDGGLPTLRVVACDPGTRQLDKLRLGVERLDAEEALRRRRRRVNVACCLLSAIRCLLHVACCMLHAVCCMLSVTCCLLHVVC